MTNAEAVSKILNSARLLNVDEHISRRYVLKVLRDVSKTLISRKLLDRTISKELDLYTHIPCVEFEQVNKIDCPIVELRRCDVLMKSKKPLPSPVFSRLGASILNIESVDGLTQLTPTDKKSHGRNKKRKYFDKDEVKVMLGEDLHLYIPDHKIYSVNVDMLTLETECADETSECADGDCKSAWESEFIIPQKLLLPLFETAEQEILGRYRAIRPDQNPNDVEGS